MSTKKRLQILGVLFLFLWTLFTLYPQPMYLIKSIYRLANPPIDPHYSKVLFIAENTPKKSLLAIEGIVVATISYQYDWQTYNMPWYFPTVNEVFEKGAGDCKSRMIVIASILEAQEEEYTINASPTHIWVEYEGKKDNSIENEEVVLFSQGEKTTIQVPKINLNNSYKTIKKGFWDYMPKNKKTSLFVGFIVFLSFNFIAFVYAIKFENKRNYIIVSVK